MTRATEDRLAALHGKVTETMLSALDQSDTATLLLYRYRKGGNEDPLPTDVVKFLRDVKEINPSLLTAATKFLKDNDISCDAAEDEKLSELEDRLKRKRQGNVTSIAYE